MAHIQEQDGLLIVPVKIRFDETSQFSEGFANISVTTFLSSLQKLPKIGRPCDTTFWRVELTSRKPHIKYWITNLAHIKEQDGLHIVPVKIRFDKTYQFAAGSANVSATRFAERFENLEEFWHQILTAKNDRSETRTSNNESWQNKSDSSSCQSFIWPDFPIFNVQQTSIVRNRNAGHTTLLGGIPLSNELLYRYCKFFFGGEERGGALISKILLSEGALFRGGRLSESGRSLDHLRYCTSSLILKMCLVSTAHPHQYCTSSLVLKTCLASTAHTSWYCTSSLILKMCFASTAFPHWYWISLLILHVFTNTEDVPR